MKYMKFLMTIFFSFFLFNVSLIADEEGSDTTFYNDVGGPGSLAGCSVVEGNPLLSLARDQSQQLSNGASALLDVCKDELETFQSGVNSLIESLSSFDEIKKSKVDISLEIKNLDFQIQALKISLKDVDESAKEIIKQQITSLETELKQKRDERTEASHHVVYSNRNINRELLQLKNNVGLIDESCGDDPLAGQAQNILNIFELVTGIVDPILNGLAFLGDAFFAFSESNGKNNLENYLNQLEAAQIPLHTSCITEALSKNYCATKNRIRLSKIGQDQRLKIDENYIDEHVKVFKNLAEIFPELSRLVSPPSDNNDSYTDEYSEEPDDKDKIVLSPEYLTNLNNNIFELLHESLQKIADQSSLIYSNILISQNIEAYERASGIVCFFFLDHSNLTRFPDCKALTELYTKDEYKWVNIYEILEKVSPDYNVPLSFGLEIKNNNNNVIGSEEFLKSLRDIIGVYRNIVELVLESYYEDADNKSKSLFVVDGNFKIENFDVVADNNILKLNYYYNIIMGEGSLDSEYSSQLNSYFLQWTTLLELEKISEAHGLAKTNLNLFSKHFRSTYSSNVLSQMERYKDQIDNASGEEDRLAAKELLKRYCAISLSYFNGDFIDGFNSVIPDDYKKVCREVVFESPNDGGAAIPYESLLSESIPWSDRVCLPDFLGYW